MYGGSTAWEVPRDRMVKAYIAKIGLLGQNTPKNQYLGPETKKRVIFM